MLEKQPCPVYWCREKENLTLTGYAGMEFVICGNCGCQGPEGDSEEDAIKLWNNRGVLNENLSSLVNEGRYLAEHGSANERERSYYKNSSETIEHLIMKLNSVVDAWEDLPGNQSYPADKIAKWIIDSMAPMVNTVRQLLNRKKPGEM